MILVKNADMKVGLENKYRQVMPLRVILERPCFNADRHGADERGTR